MEPNKKLSKTCQNVLLQNTKLNAHITTVCCYTNFVKPVNPPSDYKDSRVQFKFPVSSAFSLFRSALIMFHGIRRNSCRNRKKIHRRNTTQNKNTQNTTHMSGKGICRFRGGAFGLCSCFFLPATKKTYTHASFTV